jgi:D-alanyl-D-alanine carboxypeptidase (penicillin-binding protein 5/6)
MEIDSEIFAPVTRGQSLGQVNIKLDGELILSEPIVALQAVNEGSLIDWAMDSIKLMFR